MTIKVTMPQLGESVVEGTIGRWLVREGATVAKDEPIVEVLTDKADTEVPSPVAGRLVRILASVDATVAVGETICEIEESKGSDARLAGGASNSTSSAETAKAGASPRSSSATTTEGAPPSGPASPSVRKLARELGVNLALVRGSGPQGRITRADVEHASREEADFARERHSDRPASSHPPGGSDEGSETRGPRSDRPPSDIRELVLPPLGGGARERYEGASRGLRETRPSEPKPASRGAFRLPPYRAQPGDEIVPFTRRRKIIADHMVFSKQTSPEVVTFAECDLQRSALLRDANKGRYKKEGANLSYLALVVAATVRALREFPELNARVLDDAYVKLRNINIGIAVDTDQGLVVPVIRNADEVSVRGICRAIDDLAERARSSKLMPDDLADKTFTISNPGRRGNLVGGAIISQPNVGILRLGTIKKRPVVVERDGEDALVIHPVMYMALTYDHRIVDGVHANGFLYRITEILEAGDFKL